MRGFRVLIAAALAPVAIACSSSQPGVLKIGVALSDVNSAALASIVVVFSTGDGVALTGSLGQVDTTVDGVRVVAGWRNGASGPCVCR